MNTYNNDERTNLMSNEAMQRAAIVGRDLKKTKAAKSDNHRAVALGVAGLGVLAGGGAAAFAFTHKSEPAVEEANNEAQNPTTEQAPQPVTQHVEHTVHHDAHLTIHHEEGTVPPPPEVVVIAVVHDDESGMNIALVQIEGQEYYLVDVDNDMQFDAMLTDVNGDGQLADNEVFPIDGVITVNELGGFTDPGMLAMADNQRDYDPNGLENDNPIVDADHDYAMEANKEFDDSEEDNYEVEVISHESGEVEVEVAEIDVIPGEAEFMDPEVAVVEPEVAFVDPEVEVVDQPLEVLAENDVVVTDDQEMPAVDESHDYGMPEPELFADDMSHSGDLYEDNGMELDSPIDC